MGAIDIIFPNGLETSNQFISAGSQRLHPHLIVTAEDILPKDSSAKQIAEIIPPA